MFKGANGDPLRVRGRYCLAIEVHGRTVDHEFFVIDQLNEPVILGIDFIEAHDLGYRAKERAFRWGDEAEWRSGQVKVNSLTQLDPLSVHHLKIKVKTSGGSTPGRSDLCVVNIQHESNPFLSGGPYLVQPDGQGFITVPVYNCAPVEALIERGAAVGSVENVSDCSLNEVNPGYLNALRQQYAAAKKETLSPEKKDFILKNVNLNVPPELRDRFVKVILDNHECISRHKFDLGQTQTLLHEISLKSDEPVYVKQFKIPDAHREEVEKHVLEWLKLGVVQPARSKYNSPIFAVAKKNGGIRLVQDFRALNSQTHIDKYSMKDVSECIGEIGRSHSSIFTTIDLTGGFWQLLLQPKARPYTAFTVPGMGQFQWVTTPMGLLGAPASFQRLMEAVVRGLENVIVYIDDLLLHSASYDDHLAQLEHLLKRLGEHNVKINLQKCEFGSKNVAYLGFRLTEKGVKPGVDKLKAVEQTNPPSTVHEIRQFLGLCNFFRTHVRNFAQITAPLTALTRKDCTWKGGPLPPEALRAFRELQSQLCSEPVMAYPRRDRQYALITDACLGLDGQPGGLGAILAQVDQEGRHHAIAYASRKLQKHEANYTPFLLEMQAAVWGMDHFDTYLRGRHFLLFTDHRPLEKLGKVHTKTLNRLQEMMNRFDFEIFYKKGSEMPADYLSRNVVAAVSWETDQLARAQDQDKLTKALKEFLINKELPSDEKCQRLVRHLADSCFIENDLVWKRVKRKYEPSRVVIFLPELLIPEVLEEAHGHLLGGHDGIFKTKERLFQCYYWPGMDLDVAQHLQRCHKCQVRRKDPSPEPLLVTPLPQPTEPNQRIHADLFGPLKASGSQKKFILCMTDAFTKYVELVPLPNKEAPTVARAIFERWFCRYGMPLDVVTDQGSEFCAQLTEDLFKHMRVSHLRTTAYHPQCNSQAEVANKTIAKYLASFVDENTLDWEDYIAPLMLVYNTSFHRSIKNTPFFLTHGIEPRLPNFPAPDVRRKFYGESSSDELLLRLLTARDVARRNNELASAQSIDYANKQAVPHPFAVGQLVLLDEHSFLHKNAKLAPKWSGPHKVVRLKNENTVELKLKTGRHLITHANRLKPYLVPIPKKASVEFKDPPLKQLVTSGSGELGENFQDDDPPPPPPPPPPAQHRYQLRGLAPEVFNPPPVHREEPLFEPPPPARAPSSTHSARVPSLPLPPSRAPSLARLPSSPVPPPIPVKRGRGRPRKTPLLPPVTEAPAHVEHTPVEQGGVLSENLSTESTEMGVNNLDNTFEGENNEWVLVKRKKKQRKQGWSAAKTKNFRRFGDIYEPYHSVVPSVVPQHPPVEVAIPPAAAVPVPPAAAADLPPPVPVELLPPPPLIPVPDLPDDDSDLDYSTDEASEDEVTVRWEYPGANSPLPHTGHSSDELDDFHSAQNTPGPSSPTKARGDRTPVAGSSRGSTAQTGTLFRPLPLTPKEEKFLDKVLGTKKKKTTPPPSRSHQLRSKGQAEPGEVPSFRRARKK